MVGHLGSVVRALHACCNVCGCRQGVVLSNRDRYDFPVRTALCTGCGLIYLVDRLTRDEYSEFYASGTYRSLTSKFCGGETNIEGIRCNQVNYAAKVINALEGCFEFQGHRSLLDVGGSAGFVAAVVASRFGCAATILDPAVEEIAAAQAMGVDGVVGSLETFQSDKKFGLILLCRSIEHLFDLRASLLMIRDLLQPDGLFYCDIIDFVECCRCHGAPEAVTKIDHCYWLCQETAPAIFRALGFEVISVDVSWESDCIGYLLRRCQPMGTPRTAEAVLDTVVRRLREINSDWHSYGQVPRGIADRLQSRAYRAKRRLLGGFAPEGTRVLDRVLDMLVKKPSSVKVATRDHDGCIASEGVIPPRAASQFGKLIKADS